MDRFFRRATEPVVYFLYINTQNCFLKYSVSHAVAVYDGSSRRKEQQAGEELEENWMHFQYMFVPRKFRNVDTPSVRQMEKRDCHCTVNLKKSRPV